MGFFRRSVSEPPAVDASPKFQVSIYEPAGAKGAEFAPEVVQSLRALGYWGFSDYGAMYRRQPAVRAVVDFLARNIAQLNAKVYERVSNTDRVEVWDHGLADLLRQPNPVTTRYAHMRDTVTDLAVYDRAYWRKMFAGRRLNVVRIPPGKLTIEQRGSRRMYRLPDGTVLGRNELVVFSGYTLNDDEDGISPLETLRRVLEEEAAGIVNRANMWRNGARMSGVISRPLEAPLWSDTARQRFRGDWEATMSGGANAGRTGILEEGMTYETGSFSSEQMEYIEGRKLTYEEVAIAYTGKASVVGFSPETKANAEEYHTQLYQDVLGPWLRMLQDEIQLQLLPEFQPLGTSTTYVEFNIADKLKGSFEQQATTITTSVGVPSVAVNEGRARLNLPRIDDPRFDIPVMPMNVIYGGQPAETVPTADPGTPPPADATRTASRVKAAPDGAVRRRDAAAKEHADLMRRYFERQAASVLSAKASVDRERWDRELRDDLYLLATATTRENGARAAQQLSGTYDVERTRAYLLENARIAAEGINEVTFAALADADEPRHVFEVAKGSRADQIGLGRATALIAFARNEAAVQNPAPGGREREKTWVVVSANSRHPEMGGETVAVSENFSNGLAWPGDGSGGPAETAGCHCLLQLD